MSVQHMCSNPVLRVPEVLRLTSHLLLHPSPAQLASQAETIADLTFQRNMLLAERSDDRARWDAERECWSRSADALLYKARLAQEPVVKEQVCLPLNVTPDMYICACQETQRYITRLEDDLKACRRRVRAQTSPSARCSYLRSFPH